MSLIALAPLATVDNGVKIGLAVLATAAIAGIIAAIVALNHKKRPVLATVGLITNITVIALVIAGMVFLAFFVEFQ